VRAQEKPAGLVGEDARANLERRIAQRYENTGDGRRRLVDHGSEQRLTAGCSRTATAADQRCDQEPIDCPAYHY
jgi:hypothetical protein